MKKHVLVYGAVGGLLIVALRLVEYRWLLVERSIEIYGGVIAALFAALGVWLGLRLTRGRERVVVREVPVRVEVPAGPVESTGSTAVIPDPSRIEALGLTPRELEILRLMASGMTNREIAEAIFVSENTVKTHAARLFEKLGARRRTQAVQLGRQHALIP